MAVWLEDVIEREAKTQAEMTTEELMQKIRTFRASLDKMLKDFDN